MSEKPELVRLYVYDLSMGMAPALSQWILKKHVEAIWHTSIVVFGKEHYFGSHGITICEPGTTNLGPPKEVKVLGETHITEELFREYLQGLRHHSFAGRAYNILSHNCNTFTNEVSHFLVGKGIPQNILDLPKEIVNAIKDQTNAALLSFLADHVYSNRDVSPDFERLNNDIEETRQRSAVLEQRRQKLNEKLERQERKKKKKKKKKDKEITENGCSSDSASTSNSCRTSKMSENVNGEVENGDGKSATSLATEIEEAERKEREEKRKQRESPIVFRNVYNVQQEFDRVIGLVDGKLSKDDMQFFEELHQYMLEDEGSWALSDGFLSFIGKLLQDKGLPEELRAHLLNVLSMAALKEDIVLVLHQDRREHIFMSYAYQFDRLPVDEQKPLALFVCNLFENPSSSEWLLYISEWEAPNNYSVSNIRVTTKIAANALLSENADLQNYGTAIVHNLACKEVKSVVFDDVAVELTMALLQFFNNVTNEEYIYRCMKALSKFVQISQQEITQLIQMIGPQPNKFRNVSDRINKYIDAIESKLSG